MLKVGETHQRQPEFQLPKGYLRSTVNNRRVTINEINTSMSSGKVSCLWKGVGITQRNIDKTMVCKS